MRLIRHEGEPGWSYFWHVKISMDDPFPGLWKPVLLQAVKQMLKLLIDHSCGTVTRFIM